MPLVGNTAKTLAIDLAGFAAFGALAGGRRGRAPNRAAAAGERPRSAKCLAIAALQWVEISHLLAKCELLHVPRDM